MPEPTQADIFAALASQTSSSSRRARPPTVPFDALSTDQLTESSLADAGAGRASRNKRKVYCFREGCGCLILLPKAGEVVETEEPVLPDDTSSPFPAPAGPCNLYLRVSTAFDFENIGYSRPASGDASTLIPSSAPGLDSAPVASAGVEGVGAGAASKGEDKGEGRKGPGVKVKWLICADCDLGPIGWGYEGGKEAYLDMRRCRYAAE